MSQGPSEGLGWDTGTSLHAEQGLYLTLTSVQSPWSKGARPASSPEGSPLGVNQLAPEAPFTLASFNTKFAP